MKKIVSLLAALLLLVSMGVCVFADDAEPVSFVHVNGIRTPIDGETPSFDVSFGDEPSVRLASREEVMAMLTADGMTEKEIKKVFPASEMPGNCVAEVDENGVFHPLSSAFEEGKTYVYCFFLVPAEGYCFPEDTDEIYVDVPCSTLSTRRICKTDKNFHPVGPLRALFIEAYLTCAAAGNITETYDVEYTFLGMAKDEVPADFTVGVSRYGIDPSEIAEAGLTAGEATLVETEEGTTMTGTVTLTAPAAYMDLGCFIANDSMEDFLPVDGSIDLDPEGMKLTGFSQYARVIRSLAISMKKPVGGEAPDEDVRFVTEPAGVTVDWVGDWAKMENGEVTEVLFEGDVFEAGAEYSLAMAGGFAEDTVGGVKRCYVLTEETEVTVNGEKLGFVWRYELEDDSPLHNQWLFGVSEDEFGYFEDPTLFMLSYDVVAARENPNTDDANALLLWAGLTVLAAAVLLNKKRIYG